MQRIRLRDALKTVSLYATTRKALPQLSKAGAKADLAL